MSYTIERANTLDAARLVERLRPEELREIETVSEGRGPKEHLYLLVYLSSPALTLRIDGTVAALCGVIPESDGVGKVWFLGTPMIEERPVPFLRSCRPLLKRLSGRYNLLHNHVSVDTPHHYRWALWIGFKFFDCVLSAPDGRQFLHTYYVKPLCPQQQSPSPVSP